MTAPRRTAPGPYDAAGAAGLCGPALAGLVITRAKGFGISLCWSP